MIVDASALIAILRDEPEGQSLLRTLTRNPGSSISAANLLEAAIVIDSQKNPVLSRQLDALIVATSLKVEPVTERQARLAREAFRDFGKGSGHPAKLNFGDCFAYALAKDKRQPLLFKGNDFIHTDVRRP